MADQDSEFPEAWKPSQAQESIAGKVVGIKWSPDFGYGPYPIVTLDVQGTERAIHAFHQVLRSMLEERQVQVGHDLEVTYLGKREPKNGSHQPFHMYRVKGGEEKPFEWGSQDVGGRDEPPIQPAQVVAQTAPIPQAPVPVTVPADDTEDLPF